MVEVYIGCAAAVQCTYGWSCLRAALQQQPLVLGALFNYVSYAEMH